MLHFRKMNIDDLKTIYSHEFLKPLITVAPKGEKFGVLVEEDGNIKGGLTGYTHGEEAMIQRIMVEKETQPQLMEGLLRATVYILDLEKIKFIFTKEPIDRTMVRVGFIESIGLGESDKTPRGLLIAEDIGGDPYGVLAIEDFFDHSCG